jgi:hypothetical protein
MTTVYHGERTDTGCVVTAGERPLGLRLDLGGAQGGHGPGGLRGSLPWGSHGSVRGGGEK